MRPPNIASPTKLGAAGYFFAFVGMRLMRTERLSFWWRAPDDIIEAQLTSGIGREKVVFWIT